MKIAADFTISFLCILGIFIILATNGCQQNTSSLDDGKDITEKSNTQLKTALTSEEFEKDLKSYFNTMLAAQTAPGFYEDGARATIATTDLAAESAPEMDDIVSSLSGTNLIEAGVDESDLVKSDGRYLYIGRQATFAWNDAGGDMVLEGPMTARPDRAVNVVSDEMMGYPTIDKSKRVNPAGIRIMQLDNTTPKASEVATIDFADNVVQVLGLYLPKIKNASETKQLVVVANISTQQKTHIYQTNNVRISSYDITDPGSANLLWEFEVEGYYHASRSLNGKIYLISSKQLWLEGLELYNTSPVVQAKNTQLVENMKIGDLLPATWINGLKKEMVSATDCIIPDKTSADTVFGASLLSVLTIPINAPNKTQALCTVESSTEVYVSQQAIYFTKGEYVPSKQGRGEYYTVIHKAVFTDDSVAYQSSGRIKGWTGWRNKSFRMSEWKDDLRIVVTDYEPRVITNDSSGTSVAADNRDVIEPDFSVGVIEPVFVPNEPVHRLYVLREDVSEKNKLSVLSTLPNDVLPKKIGKPGEDIYAVRFFGAYAYVVTFQKVDPLYVLNLQDPKAPFIEGELSIPGYSDYLHPLNENLLLGVGKDAVVANNTAWFQGVKVGLFDVSDKSNPIEIGSLQIGKRGTETALSYDYKAFSIISDTESGIHRIALPVNVHATPVKQAYDEDARAWYAWTYSGVQLLEIDDGSVSSNIAMSDAGTLKSALASADNKVHYSQQPRTVLADDAIHYIEGEDVWSAIWDQPDAVIGPQ